MANSTPKIERILKEYENMEKQDSLKSEDELFKQKLSNVEKQIKKTRKSLIVISNGYLLLFIISIFGIYITIIQKNYINTIIEVILFLYSLYSLLNTYFAIRLYSGEIKIHDNENKN